MPHLRNQWIQDGRRSSSWITKNPVLRLIENHQLHKFIVTESYKYYTILQCIWKPCRDLIGDQCVPGLYSLFWRPSWIWYQDEPPIIISILETDLRPKTRDKRYYTSFRVTLVKLKEFHKSKMATGRHLELEKTYTENDRESKVLDSRHLQATFLKKHLSRMFSTSKSNAPGLVGNKSSSKC